MEGVISRYFGRNFSSSNPSSKQLGKILTCVVPKLSNSSSRMLDQPFWKEYVKHALFDMCSMKVLGRDGFLALFYQKNWDIVGDSVSTVCLGFLNNADSLEMINSDVITLIPNVKNVASLSEFHPISPCNVIYKIIAKALANRLWVELGEVITDTHSVFIPNRLISDNVLVGFEFLHAMKKNKEANLILWLLNWIRLRPMTGWNGFLESMMF
ncbi:hypothetical protein Ddye_029445 [Dipteronia dyeriana]|uniref:Reverse transcriptase domain-containing protein n=1 Tax=Dipteronia dyeriana TaxID=168575 RepID=A0AAD9WLT5_9ROSI|nr:hypothetical protein Ddye_029445 [Dipteronia dyeriana]